MMKRFVLAAVLGLTCVGTGCATIRGDKQKMTIETDPAGANLVVDGQKFTTPAEVVLKRKLMTGAELDRALDVEAMTRGGIVG